MGYETKPKKSSAPPLKFPDANGGENAGLLADIAALNGGF